MNARRLSLFAAGLLLSASTGAMTAQAADVEVAAPELWSGFYLGAQAGYMQGTGSDTDLCLTATGLGSECLSDADDGFDLSDNNMDGVTVGGYVGYNYRIDSVVLGLEGDANWDNANGSNSVLGELNYDTGINWDFSLRARLGLVVDERALLYVTGGPSWVNTDIDTNLGIVPADVANVTSGDDSTEFGWVLGAGAEYAITEHLSMKAEYLHGWYGDADLDLLKATDGVNTLKYVQKQNLQTNVVRVGLAYHFGGL
jgi:outer membrane immunogenic protein